MAVPVNIRANVRVPFPALVQANFPLTVTKANGIWTFNVDISNLADQIAGQIGGIPPNYRATTSTPVTVLSNPIDMVIGVDTVAIGGAWSVTLPVAASRGGFPLTFKDISGQGATFNGTFVPAGTETIDGVAGSPVLINNNYQEVTLLPVSQGAGAPGWVRLDDQLRMLLGNPTTQIGLSAVNGTSGNAMRSDAAPALSQAIVPTWTGAHTFNALMTANAGLTAARPVSLQGTNTNDSAPAGYVGEYIQSAVAWGTNIAMTSGALLNATTISLTAGDWDLEGWITYGGAATTRVNAMSASISATSLTIDVTRYTTFGCPLQAIFPNSPTTLVVGRSRISLAATTTIYLIASISFDTAAAWVQAANISARRKR